MFFLCRICSHHFVLVAVTTYNQRHCNAAASGSSIPQIRMGVNCFVTHQRFVKILMASWCRHYYTKKRLYFILQESNCYMKGKNPPLIRLFLQDLLAIILVKFSHIGQKIERMYHDNVFRVFFGKLLEHSSLALSCLWLITAAFSCLYLIQ